MRCVFLMDLVIGVAVLILGSFAIAEASDRHVQLAQSGKVMQCMEHCLRSEGKLKKATCKSRCADISSQRLEGPRCMAVYKQCLKPCGTAKMCRRACKKQLMTCS